MALLGVMELLAAHGSSREEILKAAVKFNAFSFPQQYMSMEAHRMHLHGESFKVLAVNGQRLPTPIVKDSVDVEAHMGAVELEFTAHNPGDWFFHCHKPMHIEGGLITLVKVR